MNMNFELLSIFDKKFSHLSFLSPVLLSLFQLSYAKQMIVFNLIYSTNNPFNVMLILLNRCLYFVKSDISKCFDSIQPQLLFSIVKSVLMKVTRFPCLMFYLVWCIS